jgi:hypothetical protein
MEIKITIEGEGLSYEGKTDLFKASQILAFLSSAVGDKERLPATTRSLSVTYPNTTSPREAIVASGATTNPEKITVLADYCASLQNHAPVTRQEVKMHFGKAGERIPRNFNRDWKEAVTLGYICEDPEQKDHFYVTSSGRFAIENQFNQEAKSKTTRRKSPKRNINKGKKGIAPEVEALEISLQWPGVLNYFDLNKGQRILWILAYADNQGIAALSPAEVEVLSGKLKDSIPARSFSALTEAIFKKGLITRSGNDKYKILRPGLDFLSSTLGNGDDKDE